MPQTTCNQSSMATRRRSVALVLAAVLAACGGDPQPQAGASGPTAVVSSAGDHAGDTDAAGELRLQLGQDAPLVLPVTYCSGQEAMYTVVAKQGEMQVDMRVLEHSMMRGDKPLEAVTEASLQRSGTEDGRAYQDMWASKEVGKVERDGEATRISGRMQGIRMHANGDGTFGSPVPIDQGALRDFSLESRCRSP